MLLVDSPPVVLASGVVGDGISINSVEVDSEVTGLELELVPDVDPT